METSSNLAEIGLVLGVAVLIRPQKSAAPTVAFLGYTAWRFFGG